MIAGALLERVKETSEELQNEDNEEALHDFRVAVRRLRSWTRAFDAELRDTLKGKHRRRLERLADATRDSRDLEVHLGWVEEFTRAKRRRRRAGTTWLLQRLRTKKARADLDLRRTLDADLARAVNGITKALSRYTVHLDAPCPPFAHTATELIATHVDAARAALASVTTIGDRAEAHEARIAAKRLRYLLEPLRDLDPRARRVVKQLSRLQDDFGALHDAQLFGNDIARWLAKALASSASANAGVETISPEPDDRADLLVAIARRLHHDEVAAYKRIEHEWLGDAADELWASAKAIALALRERADEPVREADAETSSSLTA